MASAERALGAGGPDEARRELADARAEDAHVVGADRVRRAIDDFERRRAAAAERARKYADARRALADGNRDGTLALFAELRGYRDSDGLADEAQRELAAAGLALARAAYRRHEYLAARTLARQSIATRRTAAAAQLAASADRALTAQRARARSRARARAEARRLARARARARAAELRRQRAAARRERERQREAQKAAPSAASSVPSGGTCADTPATNFPSRREIPATATTTASPARADMSMTAAERTAAHRAAKTATAPLPERRHPSSSRLV